MPPDGRRLVLDLERARVVRASVGPTAWFVLEALAERCPPRHRAVELEISTRQLSAVLGLSKDSIARALRRLTAAELVRRSDRRDERTGQFLTSAYEIDVAAAGITIEDAPVDRDRDAHTGPARHSSGHADPPASAAERARSWTQLDLLH